MRITAQLINAADGYHIWSETFNRDLHDIFAVQDEIARIIANKLRESIAEKPEEEQFVKPVTENLEAYSLYLKAVYLRNKISPPDVHKAIEYFEQAIELDPQFAYAYGYCASCYVQLGAMGQINPPKAFEIAHRYLDKTFELDDTIAEAYAIKGAAYMLYDWNWNKAHEYLTKALQLNPGSSMASFLMSIYHQMRGKVYEAITTLENALVRDPLSIMLMDALAEKYFFAKRYEDTVRLADRLLELDPHMRHAIELKGSCIGFTEGWEKAIETYEQVYQLTNHPLKGITPLAYAYAKAGHVEKAMECLSKIEQRLVEEPEAVAEADLAMVWSALGNNDRAFDYLFKAIDKR
ncbi:MAG TPA: hypothetical protein VFK47_02720, partial [Ktedonobacteraceae bacterium]|nr:hypothetical protein [Ktedonobacteraceae bacterium]